MSEQPNPLSSCQATFDTSISGATVEIEAEETEENAMEVDEEEGDAEVEPIEGDGDGEVKEEPEPTSAGDAEDRGTPVPTSLGDAGVIKATVPESTLTVGEDPAAIKDDNPTDGLVQLDTAGTIGVDSVQSQVTMPDSEQPHSNQPDLDMMQVEPEGDGGTLVADVVGASDDAHTERAREPVDSSLEPTVRPMPSNAVEATFATPQTTQFGATSDSAQPGDLTFASAPAVDIDTQGARDDDGRVEMEGARELAAPLGEGDTVGVNGTMEFGDEDIVRANQAEEGQ